MVGILVFYRVIPRRDESNLYRLRSSRVSTPNCDGLEFDGDKPVYEDISNCRQLDV